MTPYRHRRSGTDRAPAQRRRSARNSRGWFLWGGALSFSTLAEGHVTVRVEPVLDQDRWHAGVLEDIEVRHPDRTGEAAPRRDAQIPRLLLEPLGEPVSVAARA